MGYNLERLLGIYWWTWKTNICLKNCWSEPIKNKTILTFTIQTPGYISILHLHIKNLDNMIYSSTDIECDRLKLVILCHFYLFYPPKNPKNQNFEKMKIAGDIIILHMGTENHNYMMYSSWDTKWDRQNFLTFWVIFFSFKKGKKWIFYKILKKNSKKSTWRYYWFILV